MHICIVYRIGTRLPNRMQVHFYDKAQTYYIKFAMCIFCPYSILYKYQIPNNLSYNQSLRMKADDYDFESARKDFEQLKKNREIPPQMQTKLQYLLMRIDKKPTTNFPVQCLPEYQKSSLDQLNIETGTHLFCNIVNCLSGKDVVLYFRHEKAFLRKDQLLSMWKQVWITCDSNKITIRKKINEKPYQTFDVINLRISKNYKLYKKKHVFGACYNKKKNYLIGFQLESVCARIHQLLRGIIRQKVNRSLKKKPSQQVSQMSVSRMLQPSTNQTESKVQQTQQQIASEALQQDEKDDEGDEQTDRGVVIQFIKEQELNGESMYRLLKSQQNLRQLVHKNYPNKLKTELILPKPKSAMTTIFDNYIKFSEWNPEIQQSKIKIRLTDNSFLLRVRVKKYSYMSWARETVLLVTALMYRGNSFLVLRSTGDDTQDSDTVKMEWSQVVQIVQSQDKILVSISSQLDFKGYCSLDDSQRMGLRVIDNIKLFTKFYEARQISSKSPQLFNLQPVQRKRNKKPVKKSATLDLEVQSNVSIGFNKTVSQEKVRKMSDNSQFQLPDDESNEKASQSNGQNINKTQQMSMVQANTMVNQPEDFTIYLMKNCESQVSAKLIQLITKKAHERYYLKHKFDQNINIDPSRYQHTVDGPNHYILQNGNWKIDKDQDIIFINQKQLQLQKDIIKMVLKQISSNIMSGKSIMNMSLPVEIFDVSSILERVAIGLGYAPKFLVPASETQNLIQQAKLVTLFVMGIGPLHVGLQKPFNPILGQTFECLIGGIPVYLEQISHHPPISAILIKTQKFILHGAFHTHAEMGLNRVTGRNLTPIFIEFPKTNTYYQVKMADMEIGGVMHGEKKYRAIGKCFIHQRTNNIFVEYSIGKDKKRVYQAENKIKPNDVYGGIYTVAPGFSKKFKDCENKQKFDGLKPDDVLEQHVKITGHWCLYTYFNGTKVKSVQSPLPNRVQYPQYTLPSNSNWRFDLLYKRIQDLKTANVQKQVMENLQRRDRKLRQGKLKGN